MSNTKIVVKITPIAQRKLIFFGIQYSLTKTFISFVSAMRWSNQSKTLVDLRICAIFAPLRFIAD